MLMTSQTNLHCDCHNKMTLHPPRSVLLISLFSGVSLSVAVFVYKDMDQSTLVQAGDTVSLKCDYQLDTELYSIKVSEYLRRSI